MKKIWSAFVFSTLIQLTCYSQSTSTSINSDTAFRMTVGQLRTANRIFAEHRYLKEENAELRGQIDYLERSVKTKDLVIELRGKQVEVLRESMTKKDEMVELSEAINERYRKEVEVQQKKTRRGIATGVLGGIAATAVLMTVF